LKKLLSIRSRKCPAHQSKQAGGQHAGCHRIACAGQLGTKHVKLQLANYKRNQLIKSKWLNSNFDMIVESQWHKFFLGGAANCMKMIQVKVYDMHVLFISES
jgi:hypothetical protein